MSRNSERYPLSSEPLRLDVLLSIGLVLWLMSFGCGSSASYQPPTPQSDAMRQAQTAISNALVRSTDAQQTQDDIAFLARFNPAPCDCPQWEIFLWGTWSRVHLEAITNHPPDLDPLLERARNDRDSGRFTVYTVTGQLSSDLRTASTGLKYHTLRVIPDEWGISLDYR
ncbi:MAG: hypothetical protein JW797_09325 [Bradymonadales bacterium]|nr:hypothetical protein [Bradymonadales bacterium]